MNSTKMIKVGLSARELLTLERLAAKGKSRIADLSCKLLSTASLSAITEKMVKRGFISREQAPDDRRSVLVELTDEGNKILGRKIASE